ncbi:MAG: pyridoxamine 5'-phosphate oxidase family protein, partial [Sulfurimonadaceae bacterium]|nr:pyridoxamine 5'-phosphate oxidase family protein [Sulfurimonadaceae bacterium]
MKQLHESILAHIDSCRSSVIATTDSSGHPHTSYAPYVRSDSCYYILISDAATHTRNLRNTPACALLFIEDESSCEQLFARKRVSMQCSAREIPREDPAFENKTSLMQERLGDMVSMLKQMADFRLFELTPLRGEAVFGFGEAYTFEADVQNVTAKRIG